MTTSIPVGSDGHIPVTGTDSLWKLWALHQVYTGTTGAGKYVAKPGDWAVDLTTAQQFRVDSVDQITAIPVLVAITGLMQTTPVSDGDARFGTGPGDQSDNQFVYFDDSVLPNSLCVDASFLVAGSQTSFARIFQGVNISDQAACVSRLYDQTNTLVDDRIPLEMAAQDNVTNHTMKTIQPCHTTTKLQNGEKVTVVVYNDNGTAAYARQATVVKSAFVRSVNSSRKHITTVSLKSPFIAESDPMVIQYPMNVPLTGLDLMGVVHYSDGSKRELPVNGTQFAISGYENFSATKIGESFQVTLHYYPAPDEFSYVLSGGPIKHISKQYTCKVTQPDGAYNIKLFAYPRWVDEASGYRFKWFVANMDRTLLKDVTSLVRINENITPFDPSLYGITQRVIASIYFNEVNPSWRAVKHVQPLDVTLISPGTYRAGSNWSVSFNPDGSILYGLDSHALATMVNQNLWHLNLASEATTLAQWLDKFYYKTLPIKDVYTETAAPAPTHFTVLAANGMEYEFPISAWNSVVVINSALVDNDTLIVKFFKRTVSQNAIYLSVAGIPIWKI